MTVRSTLTRAALAVALLLLAGVLVWVALTRASSGLPGAVPSFLMALLPLAAAGLLFARPAVGATLAVLAALLGAGIAFVLNFCLCPMPPLGAEFIALYGAALLVLGLALLELVTLGLAWFALAIVVAVLAFSGTAGIFIAGLVVATLIAWRMLRRRGSEAGGQRTERDPRT